MVLGLSLGVLLRIGGPLGYLRCGGPPFRDNGVQSEPRFGPSDDNDDVAAGGPEVSSGSEGLPDHPLDAVSGERVADAARGRDAQPRLGGCRVRQ